MSSPTRARVYVDGFNLYYGALRGTSEKWLDLEVWSSLLLPGHVIDQITYCTARVASRADDPDAHVRQDAYLRALATLKQVVVLEGIFKVSITRMPRMPLESCACCHQRLVKVEKTEEKGSDVNLAVQLVADGFQDRYDVALVVSNDSDIQPAVDIARQRLGKTVIVADPRNRRYPALVGDERRRVGRPALVRAQLPDTVVDHAGRTITRPKTW